MRRAVLLLCGIGGIAMAAYAGAPICSKIVGSCWFQMPSYDQTNPNFAAYLTPSTFVNETNNGNTLVPNAFSGAAGNCPNPFDMSWLPYGPIPGDPYAVSGSGWFTAICCPTAESMALMGAIASKSTTTKINAGSWTARFKAAHAPAAPVGLANQSGPIFPFVPDPRQHMHVADIQRVIDMALVQGTMPNAGGAEDYITTIGGDFTPPGTGSNGLTDNISNATFIAEIKAGTVVVIAIHYYTAHVTGSGPYNITFSSDPGGHCLAVEGFSSIRVLGPPRNFVSVALNIIDPVYGVTDRIDIVNLANGTYTRAGASRTLTLPNGWTSVGVWPDSANPVNSVWDIADQEQITFIDEYHTLNVP
jgi:hypothetical protein